jgi:hypothetical protein
MLESVYMARKLLTFFALALLSLTIIAAPVQAQETNFLSRLRSSVSSRFQRVYLMLPGSKSGEAVLQQSFTTMESVKTATTTVNVGADVLDEANTSLAKASAVISGPVEFNSVYDPSSSRQSLTVSGDVTLQGTSMRAAADLKVDGNTMYFKLNELPLIPLFDLSGLKGQWLTTTASASAEETPLTAAEQTEVKNATLKLLQSAEFSPATRDTKDGHRVFVTTATVPTSAIVAYYQELSTIRPDPEVDVADSTQKLTEFLSGVESVPITFWVDAGSYHLRHVELAFTKAVPPANEQTMTAGAGLLGFLEAAKTIKVNLAVHMDQFNQPVAFDIPTDARPAQEVFDEVVGQTGLTGMSGGVGTGAESQLLESQMNTQVRMAR